MPKVKKCHLADEIFHARDDIFKAGWRKNPYECSRIPEIRVQGESMLILDHVGILSGQ
jgi:hypothetical protein